MGFDVNIITLQQGRDLWIIEFFMADELNFEINVLNSDLQIVLIIFEAASVINTE